MGPTPSFTAAGLNGSLEAAPLFDVVKMAERPGGVLVLQETIAAMPVASRNTIGYVVRAPGDTITGGGARQKHVPIASIGRWLAGWCPQQGVE